MEQTQGSVHWFFFHFIMMNLWKHNDIMLLFSFDLSHHCYQEEQNGNNQHVKKFLS